MHAQCVFERLLGTLEVVERLDPGMADTNSSSVQLVVSEIAHTGTQLKILNSIQDNHGGNPTVNVLYAFSWDQAILPIVHR